MIFVWFSNHRGQANPSYKILLMEETLHQLGCIKTMYRMFFHYPVNPKESKDEFWFMPFLQMKCFQQQVPGDEGWWGQLFFQKIGAVGEDDQWGCFHNWCFFVLNRRCFFSSLDLTCCCQVWKMETFQKSWRTWRIFVVSVFFGRRIL